MGNNGFKVSCTSNQLATVSEEGASYWGNKYSHEWVIPQVGSTQLIT